MTDAFHALQVDELKRENQKLLQIIQQLQEASLSGPCIRAVTACEAGTHCLPPDMSLAPDSLESTPSAAAAAAIMAAAVAAGASSSPANLQGLVSHPSVSNHHQQPLSSPWGLASATAAGASPLEPCNSAPASDPACVMSQPGLASAMYSSTALLPATISAPLMGTLSLGELLAVSDYYEAQHGWQFCPTRCCRWPCWDQLAQISAQAMQHA
jgi:hypothetical protein